ncbi:MAG TPA: hypothetical protein VG943_18345 [Caulobacterales bacterium]|nr:hypothetical protein [Caulobacterales bacterium]
MSDKAWNLEAIDEETRTRVTAEAEARGMSVADYLTSALLTRLVAEPQPKPPKRDDAAEFRTRITALERRLSLSFSSLEGAIAAIDGVIAQSAGEVSRRVDHTQSDLEDQAQAIEAALESMRESIDALASRLAEQESKAEEHARAVEAAAAEVDESLGALELRLEGAEAVAERESAAAEQALEHIRVGLAECASRLDETQTVVERRAHATDSALSVLHAAIDQLELKLGAQANTTGAAVQQTRGSIAVLEQRLDDAGEDVAALRRAQGASAEALRRYERTAEAQANMLTAMVADAVASAETAAEQAVAEAAAVRERMLADFVSARDTFTDALAAQTSKIRGDMDAAAEATVEHIRALDERVAASIRVVDRVIETVEMRLVAQDETVTVALGALEANFDRRCNTLSADLDRLAAEQSEKIAGAASTLRTEFEEMRERQTGAVARLSLLETRIDETSAQFDAVREAFDTGLSATRAAMDERFGALARERIEDAATRDGRYTALLERIEAQHLGTNADIARIEGALSDVIDATASQDAAHAAQLEVMRESLQDQQDDMRAWVAQVEHKVDTQMGAEAAFMKRVDKTEAELAAGQKSIRDVLAALDQRIAATESAMAAGARLAGRIDDVKSRLAMTEEETAETSHRVNELANTLGAFATQQSAASQRLETKLHALEIDLADLRLQRFADVEAENIANEFALMESRMAHLERTTSIEALDALRRSVEERMLAVESKNVRMLQQLNETIAHLAKKWDHAPAEPAMARSA